MQKIESQVDSKRAELEQYSTSNPCWDSHSEDDGRSVRRHKGTCPPSPYSLPSC